VKQKSKGSKVRESGGAGRQEKTAPATFERKESRFVPIRAAVISLQGANPIRTSAVLGPDPSPI
jgi:hypothetical protein